MHTHHPCWRWWRPFCRPLFFFFFFFLFFQILPGFLVSIFQFAFFLFFLFLCFFFFGCACASHKACGYRPPPPPSGSEKQVGSSYVWPALTTFGQGPAARGCCRACSACPGDGLPQGSVLPASSSKIPGFYFAVARLTGAVALR